MWIVSKLHMKFVYTNLSEKKREKKNDSFESNSKSMWLWYSLTKSCSGVIVSNSPNSIISFHFYSFSYQPHFISICPLFSASVFNPISIAFRIHNSVNIKYSWTSNTMSFIGTGIRQQTWERYQCSANSSVVGTYYVQNIGNDRNREENVNVTDSKSQEPTSRITEIRDTRFTEYKTSDQFIWFKVTKNKQQK